MGGDARDYKITLGSGGVDKNPFGDGSKQADSYGLSYIVRRRPVVKRQVINKKDFVEGVLLAFASKGGESSSGEFVLKREDYQLGLSKMFFRSGKQEMVEALLRQADDLSQLPPTLVIRVEMNIYRKRKYRFRGAVKFLGRLWLWLRRVKASRVLQCTLHASIAWNTTLNFRSPARIAAMNKIKKFWKWCKKDRAREHMLMKTISGILKTLREQRSNQKEYKQMLIRKEKASDLAGWINKVLDNAGRAHPKISPELFSDLTNGEVLCDLVNVLTTAQFQINDFHRNAKLAYLGKDNIGKFLKALGRMRAPQWALFEADDLFQNKNPDKVIVTLRWLARFAAGKGIAELPPLMAKELSMDEAEEDRDDDMLDGPPRPGSRRPSLSELPDGLPDEGGGSKLVRRPSYDASSGGSSLSVTRRPSFSASAPVSPVAPRIIRATSSTHATPPTMSSTSPRNWTSGITATTTPSPSSPRTYTTISEDAKSTRAPSRALSPTGADNSASVFAGLSKHDKKGQLRYLMECAAKYQRVLEDGSLFHVFRSSKEPKIRRIFITHRNLESLGTTAKIETLDALLANALLVLQFADPRKPDTPVRSEERFSRNAETDLVCRLLLEKKK
eukprot:TRINITY_DN3418_c0_g1_i7.p1 TRINITY_DN3418_c0_g1~~TRINITY_DN3418_c0_g1_i7.p1  ORF type:complete len:706 (-),score=82.43 TRINITY_DN3418_c0_g1_i7:10-1857(-)